MHCLSFSRWAVASVVVGGGLLAGYVATSSSSTERSRPRFRILGRAKRKTTDVTSERREIIRKLFPWSSLPFIAYINASVHSSSPWCRPRIRSRTRQRPRIARLRHNRVRPPRRASRRARITWRRFHSCSGPQPDRPDDTESIFA